MMIPPGDDDTDLRSRIRAGDQAAFEALVTRMQPELYAYVVRWTGSTAFAWDILQEMFLQLWRTRATFETPHGVRAHLYAATRGRVLRHLRGERRLAAREGAYAAAAREERASTPSADSDGGLSDDRAALVHAAHAAVDALPDRAREVWRLCREQELTYAEAAAVLGVSPNTVKTQLSRAMRAVRAAVAPWLPVLLVRLW